MRVLVPVSDRTGRAYGHVPSKARVVHRAYSLDHVVLPHEKMPAVVSQLQWMPPVYDQGQEGSCTAFGAKEVREWLSTRYPGKYRALSAQFQYYCERLLNGDVPDDAGSSVSTAMASMRTLASARTPTSLTPRPSPRSRPRRTSQTPPTGRSAGPMPSIPWRT